MRRQEGQASIEYAALLVVVAAILVTATALVAAPGIVNAVTRGFRRGLCVVGGGDCLATERRPCVVRTATTAGEGMLAIGVVRLGGGMLLLREKRSDGSVDVTLLDHIDAGVAVRLGAEAH